MKKLYVGNLPHAVDDEELKTIFEAHGEVSKANVIVDRDTKRSRGFGFVEMSDSAEADAAIEAMNGAEVGGRTLTVNEARPQTDRPSGGGGPRSGGGFRGGRDRR